MKTKIVLVGILMIVLAVFAVSSAAAHPIPTGKQAIVWFEPDPSSGLYGENVTVKLWINTSVYLAGWSSDIYLNKSFVNITKGDWTGSPFDSETVFSHYFADRLRIAGSDPDLCEPTTGEILLVTLTLQCKSTSACTSELRHQKGIYSTMSDCNIDDVPTEWVDGNFTCTAPAAPINVDIRADGINSTIFNAPGYSVNPGTVTEDGITINNQTAMGALVAYCQENGINVNITLGAWGEYVIQIGNDPADQNCWMYAVNETVPGVGGAQYNLSGGEFVHWFNYMLNYYTVLTTLNTTLVNAGDYLNATVTWRNTTGVYPLSGASVNVSSATYTKGPSVGTTRPDGNCTFQWSTPGTWYVYAVHPTYGSGINNYPPVSFTCLAPEETFSKPLVKGWNQISLPLTNAANMTVANIMSSVSGSYDALYRYDAPTRSWVSMSSADTMANGVGYFIHLTQNTTWTYTGSAVYTSMNAPLEQGLNMVGWLNCSKPITDALSSIDGKYYYVARWNATARKFETYVPVAPPAFNKFTTMDRGEGYFISMKTGDTLSESC